MSLVIANHSIHIDFFSELTDVGIVYQFTITQAVIIKETVIWGQKFSYENFGTSYCNRLVSQMRAILAASREPAGKLWQLCKVLYVF